MSDLVDTRKALAELERAARKAERAAQALEAAERAKARAVFRARAAGVSTRQIGGVIGVSHAAVIRLCERFAEEAEQKETTP